MMTPRGGIYGDLHGDGREVEARQAPVVHTWNYFNGAHYTKWGTGEVVNVPMTEWYCGTCAPTHVKGWDANARPGTEHHGTDFKSAPWHVGKPCCGCGKDI